ncbi:DUF3616 domain-containing protein [Methylocapsa palsarum]|uniref:DUF3616 domain-containing protein n=1 Tax=Methylocapsa palsarum TaxID=1612308 RepID=A0A1I3VVB7_9HYPH|nr:DUF3616 domain-containing protein [Methylocapsa palsarum]SFJ99344.1 Protein of unknown function [Methylocapsa palsarum]
MRTAAGAIAALVLAAGSALMGLPPAIVAAFAEPLRPLQAVQLYLVDPPFLEKDNGKDKIAEDLSGAACDRSGLCLAINDQSRSAQFFTIDNGHIAAGKKAPLIDDVPSPSTLGEKPAAVAASPLAQGCLDQEPVFKDLDGEGVAYAAPYFYIVGSHGCSRAGNEFVLSSFILARLRADENGARIVETTYRLGDALRTAPKIGPFFGKHLIQEDGLNIEGLAVVGDKLFAGLRAPTIEGAAYLVGVKVSALFAPGHEPLRGEPEIIPIALGCNVGVRDMAAMPDGRLLVLAGPAQEQWHIPFSLFTVEPRPGGAVKQIAVLEDVFDRKKRAKAEAVTVLGVKPLRVLIFFDGPKNGAPREYVVLE